MQEDKSFMSICSITVTSVSEFCSYASNFRFVSSLVNWLHLLTLHSAKESFPLFKSVDIFILYVQDFEISLLTKNNGTII